MAEATSVTYRVFNTITGIKEVGVEWGNAASADTLTLTGAASVSTIKMVFAGGKAAATNPLFSVGGSNVLTFNQSTTGSGFALIIGV